MDKSVKLYIFFCSLFCTIIITGNLIFQKFITVNILFIEFELSVGVLLYPATFLISDLVTEFYGKDRAGYMIKMSVICSFIVMGLVMIGDFFPATSWSKIDDESFHRMFGVYGIATISSIVATFFAQMIDVQIFSYLKKLTKSRHLWIRNNVSTIIGQILDTILVLSILCAAHILSWEHYFQMASSSIAFKLIAALADTPFCYLGHSFITKFLGKDAEKTW